MNSAIGLVRKFLHRFGLEIKRNRLPALRIDELLFSFFPQHNRHQCQVFVFDQECRAQALLLKSFPLASVCFLDYGWRATPPRIEWDDSSLLNIAWLGSEELPLNGLLELAPAVSRAEYIFVRSTIAELSSGRQSFGELIACSRSVGFELHDVAIHPEPVLPNVAHSHVVLFLVRGDVKRPQGSDARSRTTEAHAFLSSAIAQPEQFRLLAGRGSFGFKAGVFNPGAILYRGRLLALTRGETSMWTQQERNQKVHFKSCRPLLLEIHEGSGAIRDREILLEVPDRLSHMRFEDFRLFQHGGRCLCAHSVISLPGEALPADIPVTLHKQISRVGLSEIDCDAGIMRFLGFPTPDFRTGQIEKNWAMIGNGETHRFIYSMSPFRVLEQNVSGRLEFRTIINRRLKLPFLPDGSSLRNSINPIDYDADHYLHIVHRMFPSKQYVYWGLLLDKRTLMPTHVTECPIARAGFSASCRILYLCSAVLSEAKLMLFCGVDDQGSGYWTLDRSVLDHAWRALPAEFSEA
jgi:hypothetical protein